MSLSEIWLVRRSRSGDSAAFGELYRRHAPRVYNLLRRLGQSEADAEDLTQETFLAAYRNLPSWRAAGTLSAWLCGIAVGCARSARRKAATGGPSPHEIAEDDVADTHPLSDPFASVSASETQRLLMAAIETLPTASREAFVLVYVEEFQYHEAAQMLGIPIGTVQSRLNRAKRLLHERLTRDASGGGGVGLLPTTSLPSSLDRTVSRFPAEGVDHYVA